MAENAGRKVLLLCFDHRCAIISVPSEKAISLVAEYSGIPVGYINIYPNSTWGALGGKGYPEIVDFGVLEKYRNQGIGTALMDIAEKAAAEYADIVYLGVGLHSGYGSAQRMYVKRGYMPDGSGAWYNDEICRPYEEMMIWSCIFQKNYRKRYIPSDLKGEDTYVLG